MGKWWKNWLLPKPFHEGYMATADGHSVYYCEYGNPRGVPVLSFHGGPGGQARPKYAKLFAAKKYHFIQFDQRGSGRSTATDIWHNNTTEHLLEDARNLLDKLGIKEKIIVNGGSWGSTLALLFAEKYPDMVQKIIVTSIYLARPTDSNWVTADSERFYPDMWAKMREIAGNPPYASDFFAFYERMLFSAEPAEQLTALTYWGNYEFQLGQLNPTFTPPPEPTEADLTSARLSFYYMRHHYFMTPNQILDNADKIAHIPTLIVHNRLDFCCPVNEAWDLHRALPLSELHICAGSGHSSPQLLKASKLYIQKFLEK